jgi:hypothetical protein
LAFQRLLRIVFFLYFSVLGAAMICAIGAIIMGKTIIGMLVGAMTICIVGATIIGIVGATIICRVRRSQLKRGVAREEVSDEFLSTGKDAF